MPGPIAAQDGERLAAQYLQTWATTSLLASIPRSCLHELLAASQLKTFTAGETLISEGDNDTAVFLLLRSYVKVEATVGAGEALLAVRSGGDVVGELAASDGQSRSATVKACGRVPVLAAHLAGDHFWDLLSADRLASRLMTASVSRKLRSATRRRVDYTGCVPKVRMARVLFELASTHGVRDGKRTVVGLDLTQIELGFLIGVAQATAERALRELRTAKLLDASGKRLIILDMAALADVAALG